MFLSVFRVQAYMGNARKIFDGLLVLQYRSGNKKALSLLVNRYHLRLCKHSYWYTHDIDASKDIVQDCWSIIIHKLGNLKDPDSFGSWATRIVTRKSLDYLNNSKKTQENLEAYSRISNNDGNREHMENKESDISRLVISIRLLPSDQQRVLRLFYTEDYSLREIGHVLDISVGTVKSRLFHAREKLKTILKNKEDEKKQ